MRVGLAAPLEAEVVELTPVVLGDGLRAEAVHHLGAVGDRLAAEAGEAVDELVLGDLEGLLGLELPREGVERDVVVEVDLELVGEAGEVLGPDFGIDTFDGVRGENGGKVSGERHF